MNIRDIEHMWKVASNNPNHDTNWHDPVVIAFVALVEAQEREACAALCFSIWNKWLDTPEEDRYKVLYDAEDCAAAIRERGTT